MDKASSKPVVQNKSEIEHQLLTPFTKNYILFLEGKPVSRFSSFYEAYQYGLNNFYKRNFFIEC